MANNTMKLCSEEKPDPPPVVGGIYKSRNNSYYMCVRVPGSTHFFFVNLNSGSHKTNSIEGVPASLARVESGTCLTVTTP